MSIKNKKVMISVPTGEFGRHAAFYDYYNLLDKPDGSVATFSHGQSPAKARNLMIEAAFEHDCTHIFLLDDDMLPPPDTLMRLMAHDKDIVGGYYLMRQYPHQGLVFDDKMPDGTNHWYEVQDSDSGLIETTSTGLGCVLFNLEVFKDLAKPWVRLGEIQQDEWCDDIGLFNRLRADGWQVWVDLDACVGHIGNVAISPIRMDGKWGVSYNTFGPDSVAFPMIRRQVNGHGLPKTSNSG